MCITMWIRHKEWPQSHDRSHRTWNSELLDLYIQFHDRIDTFTYITLEAGNVQQQKVQSLKKLKNKIFLLFKSERPKTNGHCAVSRVNW